MSVSYDFEGKVALITGAARGVGRELVNSFVKAGARVVALDRDAAGVEEACQPHSGAADPLTIDITKASAVAGAMAETIERCGRLDICVNNAAVAPHTSLHQEDAQTWDVVHAVNARGTFLLTQAASTQMRAQGDGGRIINFSSGVTKRGSPGAAAYASSRAAVESLTRVAAIELAPQNILVNCVRPGLIDTQPKPLPPSMAAALRHRIPRLPLARPGRPSEVANLVLWLSSEAASYVTGAIIDIDGGASIGVRAEAEQVVDEDPRYLWTRLGRDAPPD